MHINSKDKAKQLIKMFANLSMGSTIDSNLNSAKSCALLCVQEIINDNPNIYDSDRLNYKYWNEVKRQINLVEPSE